MIEKIKPCAIEEIKSLGNYLVNKSYVQNIGKSLLEGQSILKAGKISSLRTLGSLKTMTGFIDNSAITGPNRPIQPTSEFRGEKKYLVKEILPSLQGRELNDGGHIQTIEKYMKMFAKGDHIDMIVSSVEYNNDFMLIDGNKRSVAYYETMKSHNIDNIDFTIYIIPINNQN